MPDLPEIQTADLRVRMENLAHQINDDLRRIDSLEADLRRLQALIDEALSPPRPRPNPHCPTTLTVRPYMRAATGHLKRLISCGKLHDCCPLR